MAKFPFFKQMDSMDCGPTCLRMVAKYYGRSVPQQFLREKTEIGKEGVTILGIGQAAEIIGFWTHAVKVDINTLMNIVALPAILHWNQNHFVVLYKVKDSMVFIADPAKGLLRYSQEEFKEHWGSNSYESNVEGIALLLKPTENFQKATFTNGGQKDKLHFKRLVNYIIPYKKLIFPLLISLLLASALQVILPFLTRSVVDYGISSGNLQFIYIILLSQLALLAGRMAIEFVRSWMLLHISIRVNMAILTDFLIKLMRLPVCFFDSKHTGDLLQRMSDHSRIETFLTGTSLTTLFSIFNLLIFSTVLVTFNSYIFFVFISASALYSVWGILFFKKRKTLDHKRFDVSAKEQSEKIQLIQGMTEIKLNGVERYMRWKWEKLQANLFSLTVKSLTLNQQQQTGAFFINEGKNIIVTFLAAKAVIEGQMTLGSMVAVQFIVGQLNSPIEQLMSFLQSWQNAKISMERLNEIHTMDDEEPEFPILQLSLPVALSTSLKCGELQLDSSSNDVNGIVNHFTFSLPTGQNLSEACTFNSTSVGGGGYPTIGNADAIVFQDVSFSYPGAGSELILRDISLSLPIGKTTAIVGVSGSGKTTILKLLLKFYQAQKGEIRFGPFPLSSISHREWRSYCGVVMQESFIFSDTIARNIAVGVDQIDEQRLQHAVEIANAKEFIESLPLAYNTKIGAEGAGISAGQKQRILIARAVYRDPEIILFDEATNSLDANNESTIIQNLTSFFRNRTVVVVAHQLSTVKNADQIIVLNKGVISEIGTHQELVNKKGDYFTLVKNQLELTV